MLSNRDNIIRGLDSPIAVDALNPPKSCLLVSSRDSEVKKNDFNFSCALNDQLNRAHTMKLNRVSIPLPPNINKNNKHVRIVYIVSTTIIEFDLPEGYFGISDLCNAFNGACTTEMFYLGISDSLTMTYTPWTKTFQVTSSHSVNFYFDKDCSFIKYGVNVCNFNGYSIADYPSASQYYQISNLAQMVYTRYISINSDSLANSASFGLTKTTNKKLNKGNVICLMDISDIVLYDSLIPLFNSELPPSATANLLLRRDTNKLNSFIDVQIYDEFGFEYNDCFISSTGKTCTLYFTVEY